MLNFRFYRIGGAHGALDRAFPVSFRQAIGGIHGSGRNRGGGACDVLRKESGDLSVQETQARAELERVIMEANVDENF